MSKTIKITQVNKDCFSKHKETVILIHGFLCSITIWNKLISILEKEYNIFLIALPGHNKDENTITSVSDLALITFKEIKKHNLLNSHIIGHSFGGYLGGEIVKQFPSSIKSLTLLNSTLLADSELKKSDRELAIRAVKITPTIFTKNVIEKLFLEKNRLKLNNEIEQIQKEAREITSATIISYLNAMKNRESTIETFKKIPIHFIASINDTTIPYETIPKQVKMSNAHLTTLKDSGHMSFLEESDLVAKSINSFFVSFTS